MFATAAPDVCQFRLFLRVLAYLLVPLEGFEPPTCSLGRSCLGVEPQVSYPLFSYILSIVPTHRFTQGFTQRHQITPPATNKPHAHSEERNAGHR